MKYFSNKTLDEKIGHGGGGGHDYAGGDGIEISEDYVISLDSATRSAISNGSAAYGYFTNGVLEATRDPFWQSNQHVNGVVELKSSYSYAGVKNGIVFSGLPSSSPSGTFVPDLEVVNITGIGRVLHSTLPFYSDSFVSACGVSSGGGGGGTTLEAVWASLTNDIPITPTSTTKIDSDHIPIGTGLGVDGNGNIYVTSPGTVTGIKIGSYTYTPSGASTIVDISAGIPTKVSDLTNDSGFITGINSSMVTGALGYTPVNPTSVKTLTLKMNRAGTTDASIGTYNPVDSDDTTLTILSSNIYDAIGSTKYHPYQGSSSLYMVASYYSLGTQYIPSGESSAVDSKLVWDDTNKAWHLIGNFYADGWVSAMGVSSGGGSGSGNASMRLITGGGEFTNGTDTLDVYSMSKVDELVANAGQVKKVAGVSPDSNGNIPTASLSTALGLGTAASYAVASTVSQGDSTHLVTGAAVYTAINSAVSSVLRFEGVSSTTITDGGTQTPTINGQQVTPYKGMVVLYGAKEFVWDGSAWEELGDEASWALKTTTINGYALSSNITLTLDDVLDGATRKLSDYMTTASLTSKGSASMPIYFDSNHAAQEITSLDLLSKNTGYVKANRFYLNASTYFELDTNGYVHLVHPSGKGFYADGFVSACGVGSGGGAGGIDPLAMWRLLTNDPTLASYDDNTKIAVAHIPDLSGTYQTKYGFTIQGTSGATYNLANFATTSALSDYLPLAAGPSYPLTNYLLIQNGSDAKIVLDNTDNDTDWSYISFRQNGTEYGSLGTKGSTNLVWGTNTILHAGNYSTYALPLTGGTIQSASGTYRLRLVTASSGAYVQAGTSSATNGSLYLTGYSGEVGNTLYAYFSNIRLWNGSAWVDPLNTYLPLAGGTMTGNISFSNNKGINGKDTGGTERSILLLTSSNQLFIGDGMKDAPSNGKVYLRGVEVHVQTAALAGTYGDALIINSSKNATFGASDLAGTSYKLYVSGSVAITNNLTSTAGNIFLTNGGTNGDRVFGITRTDSNKNVDVGWNYANTDGAGAGFRSVDHSSPGEFCIFAKDSSSTKQLVGKPDGTLTWAGNTIYHSGNLAFSNGLSLSSGTVSNSGVRSVSISGNYLRVNTNGTNSDLTIPYALRLGAEDYRSSYPSAFMGGDQGRLIFMSGSTVGVGTGYVDALVLNSWHDTSGGNTNAILMRKSDSNVWHTQFTYGSSNSWGTPVKFLDTGNFVADTNYLTPGTASSTYVAKAGDRMSGILLMASSSITVTGGSTRIQTAESVNDVVWPVALKNYYHATGTSGVVGVGLKLSLGYLTEGGKWAGIAAMSESDNENNVGMRFYVGANNSISAKMSLSYAGNLSLSAGSISLNNAGASGSRTFGITRTNNGENIDLGWNWDNVDGAGAFFRASDASGSAPGGFGFFARSTSSDSRQLVGKTDGNLTWQGRFVANDYQNNNWNTVLGGFAASLGTGKHVVIKYGKADTKYNCGAVQYYHVGDGSTSNMVALGFNGVDYQLAIRADSTVQIGYSATTGGAQKLNVNGNILATGAITAGSASDVRLKTNINTLSDEQAKALIMALRPVTFTWNEEATKQYSLYVGNDLGFVAQEVEKVKDVIPGLSMAIGTIFNDYKRLDATRFIGPIVRVEQDHEKRIRALEKENKELKEEIKRLKTN